MTTLHRPLIAMFALLTLAATARGQGLIIIDEPPRDFRGRLELRSHQVDAKVHDQVAVTTVEHVFYNPTGARLEGHFMFPLPVGAQVDKVSMDVNGVDTDAELLDADKARGIYEDIVRKMRDPALLEYCDAGMIRARIFPIEPRSEKRITMTYTTLLKSSGGLISYDYPLNRHAVEGAPITKLAMRIELETTRKLATIYSPSHEMQIKRRGERRAIVGFETTSAAERNVQLLFAPQPKDDDDLAMTLLTYREAGDKTGFFMLLATPTSEAKAEDSPKSIVFVIDTSGSMAGEKLEQAKRALRFCIANLNDHDRFEVIRFSTDVEPLFGHFVAPNEKTRDKALEFIEDLRPIGGTAIHDALRSAREPFLAENDASGPAYIVFLTDGMPTIGETDHDKIVKDATTPDVRTFCFGIGTDINTKLLDRIAERTRAATEYVLPEEDLEVKLSSFYSKIDLPALADPKLTVAGDRIRLSKFQPTALPDLFHGDQLVLFGRYTGDGDATLTLTGERGDDLQAYERTVTFEAESTRHDFIPRMWATRRVGFLLDEMRLSGENEELRDEVVRLARRYGILTPYTSYLIVEDEDSRAVPLAQRSMGELQEAPAARAAMADDYSLMLKSDSGRAGIEANRANASLRRMDKLASTTAPAPASERIAGTYRQQASQVVAGRAFVQNGPRWVDTNVQAMPDATVRRIAFASDDYFNLLRDHPETAAWLSVGQEVTFQLGDDVIEIVNN